MPRYLVEHVHRPEDCVWIRNVIVEWARRRPPQLVEVYWEPGAHRGWFVVEAADHLEVNDLVGIVVEHSTNTVRCVLGLDEIKRLDVESSG